MSEKVYHMISNTNGEKNINNGQTSRTKKYHTVISMQKKHPTSFHNKNTQQTQNRIFSTPIKAVSEKHSVNIILTVKDHRLSPLRSETKQGGPLEPFLFNMVIEFLARAISQENRRHPDWKRSKTISIPRRHDLIYRKSCQ